VIRVGEIFLVRQTDRRFVGPRIKVGATTFCTSPHCPFAGRRKEDSIGQVGMQQVSLFGAADWTSAKMLEPVERPGFLSFGFVH
jgi:hypothetical protein